MQLFADRTYEAILAEMLAQAPAGVDTRQGSIYFDAVAACALKLANFYVDAGCVLDLVFVGTASGKYLDAKGQEYGLTRNPSTPARYHYIYEGTRPLAGARFFTDGLYFTLEEADGALYLAAEAAGEEGNGVIEGTPAVPVNTIVGLSVSEFGPLFEPGTDEEDDEGYRTRIREKLGGPAQNGNKQHYKTWCEEVAGVGRARILPLWNGVNTVKGVLLDTDGLPASSAVVARVQEHVDPGGTGLGEGTANIGAYFTAIAAQAVPLTVSWSVTLASGYTLEQAKAAATAAITVYLKSLVLDTPGDEAMVVRISSVGALLYAQEAILDYANLTINGGASNIEIGKEQVAVLEEVDIVGTV